MELQRYSILESTYVGKHGERPLFSEDLKKILANTSNIMNHPSTQKSPVSCFYDGVDCDSGRDMYRL